MAINPDVATIARDPRWFAYRHDPGHDAFHLLRLEREGHRQAAFLRDDCLPADLPKLVLRRADMMAAAPPPAPIHFILHSAYCGSTLLARAFDLPGVAMGLKEPPILNDMVGWRRRGGDPKRIGAVLDESLRLLARPFGPGEAVIVKPSNIVNSLAASILAMRPGARAVLLHAPLPTFLASIANKGMWGRLWVRELLVGMLKDGVPPFGFDAEQMMGQSDLQVAALGWLMQHQLFAGLVARFGPARVRTLDSETLVGRAGETIAAVAALFGLPIDAAAAAQIADGAALRRHSKTGEAYDARARSDAYRDAATVHGDEIDKVVQWAEAVAASAGLPLDPPEPLVATRAPDERAPARAGA